MWVNFDPCGPFAPEPPDSRLSSLLWQSVQRICVPIARPCLMPSRFIMLGSRLGCENVLLRACMTGWLEVADAPNCGTKSSGSPAETARTAKYPNLGSDCLPGPELWQRRQFSY